VLKRILSAAFFIPLAVFAIFETMTGGVVFLGLLLVLAFLTASEYFELLGSDISSLSRIFGISAVVATVSLCYILGVSVKNISTALSHGAFGPSPELGAAMVAEFASFVSIKLFAIVVFFLSVCLLAFFLIQIRRTNFEGAFKEVSLSFLAVPYIGFGFGSLALLHALPEKGKWLVLLAFVIVWVTDSFALFVGKLIGRHRLGIEASPNKTVEGTLGGIFFALAAAAALKLIFPDVYSGWGFMSWPGFLALTFVFSIVGQIGDLAESVLKRSLGTKDSGGTVPGHGGLLDVFDAQLVVSPLMLGFVILLAGMQ
jgi:phosphatidate cytidylyltransferase